MLSERKKGGRGERVLQRDTMAELTHAGAAREGGSTGLGGWLRTYSPLLLLFAGVVAYQTKGFGYYSDRAIRERMREEAENSIKFGEVDVRHTEEGTGAQVQRGEWVTVKATGWSANAGKFWSTAYDKEGTITFYTGEDLTEERVIPGVEQAILSMKVGGTATAVIPPDLAFGERGKGAWGIEPWATVRFELTVVSASKEVPASRAPPVGRQPSRLSEDGDGREGEGDDAAEREEAGGEEEEERGQGRRAQRESEKAGPQVTAELRGVLEKIGLVKWEAALADMGLVSVEDLGFLEKVDDLPDTIPLFTRKKLLAHAVLLRQANGSQSEKKEEETVEKKVEEKDGKDSASVDTGNRRDKGREERPACTKTEEGVDTCSV